MNRKKGMIGGTAAVALVMVWVLTIECRAADPLPADLILCLDEARRADAAHDIARERQVLTHAETLDGAAKDAAEVQRRLAVLDWKYLHRFDEARSRLLRAAATGAEPAKAWIALARLEQARADYPAAWAAATTALDVAGNDAERRGARRARARAAVAEAAALRQNGQVGHTGPLREAFDELSGQVRREPGEPESSQLLLGAALLLDRGDEALAAWRSYYRLTPGGPTPNVIAAAGAELERILPRWPGAGATPADRIELVRALAEGRFFAEAALVALDPRADASVRESATVRPIEAYARGLVAVRRLAEEHYRQTILGGGDPDEFARQIGAQAAPVLAALGVDRQPPPTNAEVDALLDQHFGTYIAVGWTAGYYDLHLGHRVLDETRVVKQYSHEASLRFVVLDSMVSNGFQSWAWESGAQHGGWAGRDTIWQIRPVYANAAMVSWQRLHSEPERAEYAARLARETALDDARARRDPYGFLPGLALRLQLQADQALEARLVQRGIRDEDLRLAFLAEHERSVQESSIFAHEGRHAIDQRLGTKMGSPGQTEYYAKLSEVVFTAAPRLALDGIFDANIGDPTPHGQANRRIMKGLVKWMKQHRREIAGLDPQRPLLPQFDRLTDDQIRQAFRSMDPLAK
ncbi:MAG TPA: hypothetical protein PLN26_15815 [Acidobacteriota bacterium]|nr:hypothetical protein [Acidobacteriota bacterium]HQG92978.1 hypothetical protein [Acidobacteriota bacterium]